MKKYVLDLIDTDIEKIENHINYWEKMEDKWKQDPFQIKRRNALENKLKKIKNYRVRFDNFQ